MPRRPSYWTQLPLKIWAGKDIDGVEVLKSWGVESWGFDRDWGKAIDYEGWQRVHIPDGWRILLEAHHLVLVDHRDQIRGEIQGTLKHIVSYDPISVAFREAFAEVMPKRKKRLPPEPPGPTLILRRAIRLGSSFTLGNTFSRWVENAHGNTIYGLHDLTSSEDYSTERKAHRRIMQWVRRHYPDWRSFHAYWEPTS